MSRHIFLRSAGYGAYSAGSTRLFRSVVGIMAFAAGTLAVAGCDERPPELSAPVTDPEVVGLTGSVALFDKSLDRLVFLTSPGKQELAFSHFPVGLNVTSIKPSADQSQLFVLSEGEYPRTQPDDEEPRLMVFDGGIEPALKDTILLDDPMGELAVDPRGEWVVAFAGASTVTNPNELIFVDLTAADPQALSRTIRSYGGSPRGMVFTDALTVPRGGARRFLVVRTDRDLALLDLAHLEREEVTVQLPKDNEQKPYQPAQIIFDDGDPEADDDARIAIRLQGSSDVVLLQLGASSNENKDFKVVVNIVDVGGVPSNIDFVRTDGGLRLAALVPEKQQATLVNPDTTFAETVTLPHRFNQMTRITSVVEGTPDGGDVALLWGQSTSIAFWSLGSTSATPYRSIDATDLGMQVSEVIDVPVPNQHLKVLVAAGSERFFVLDLRRRESFPLNTDGSGFSVTTSLDGARLWVARPGGQSFSAVQLSNLHPLALYVDEGVRGIFDIERADTGRSAVALHLSGETWGATVLDAEVPASSETTFYPALELEGLK